MTPLLSTIAHHGYLIVFLIVFAEAAGLPAPAALALIAAGAAAAIHFLNPTAVLVTALIAMMLGDITLFILGRYTGWTLLGFLCRLSLNPETCILRSAETFYKRGRAALIFAKFIPGLNSMAPPLAGSMKMRTAQFLRLDFLGTSLYVLAYSALGFIFHNFVAEITRGLQSAGHAFAKLILFAIIAFIVYRIIEFRRHRITGVVPRIEVAELAKRLLAHDVVLIDVRSHGYYDPGAARIAGSIRIEPNLLTQELKSLPKDKDIYVYCT
jgi:membrane protein DedA with SNARE-associated domain